jgi:hypothetical protein
VKGFQREKIMDLFHLTRKENVDFDEAEGFVVQATDELMARLMCASHCGDEGQDTWTFKDKSACEKIGVANPAKRGHPQTNRIVQRAFKNG